MSKGDLDDFCLMWEYNVIFVWGSKTFDVMTSAETNVFLANPKNLPNYEDCFPPHYKVVIFDANKRCHNSLTHGLFGGNPTLIIDVSMIRIESVIGYPRSHGVFYGAWNLPFWIPWCTIIHLEHGATSKLLAPLIKGCKRPGKEVLFANLLASTVPSTEGLCMGCFHTFQPSALVAPSPQNGLLSGCETHDHALCGACFICHYTTHKVQYVDVTANGFLEFDFFSDE